MAALAPWQSWPSLGPGDPTLFDLESTPLAKQLEANFGPYLIEENTNEVARRAIVQVMAIRAWQLEHDGQFPDRLERIVPERLPSLPLDPYSGRPFGYIPYAQANWTGFLGSIPARKSPETRVLYSAGLNREEELGASKPPRFHSDDIIFLIPPLGADTLPPPADLAPAAPEGPGQAGMSRDAPKG
jgi:hypothetical protein